MTTTPTKTTPAKRATPAKRVTPAKPSTPAKRAPRPRRPKIRGVAALRAALLANETPVVFVGPTPCTLLGLDRWVGGLRFVTLHDPYDGAHQRLFSPDTTPSVPLSTGQEITNHLLADPEVRAHLADLGASPKIIAVAADADTERLCAELGAELIVPTRAETERLTPLVEAPATTGVVTQHVTVPVVVTRKGTLVGPYVTSLLGHPSLTPDPYGWCGSETSPTVLTDAHRAAADVAVHDLGERLAAEEFRGYAEIHLAISETVTVSSLTPGIGAATQLSTLSPSAYADLPPYAVHLAERLGLDYELDVAELNQRSADLVPVTTAGQLVISSTETTVPEVIVDAPVTGRYALDELGRPQLLSADLDPHALTEESEFFFLRIAGPGDHRWLGSDLGIVITRGRVSYPPFLSARAQGVVDAVRRQVVSVPAYAPEPVW